jgi:hypothetical protein
LRHRLGHEALEDRDGLFDSHTGYSTWRSERKKKNKKEENCKSFNKSAGSNSSTRSPSPLYILFIIIIIFHFHFLVRHLVMGNGLEEVVLRCQPRTAAGRPSSRTSTRQAPTSPRRTRSPPRRISGAT